ncbi:hypothetical protein JKF63_04276 [Porcisia hertigi]|uniref:Syntaxin binding protein 1 n=1 Tax=Porcisia hertigi TaxID=2761500 RepID=A0A836IE34_9TRYP|nr:hypothetical protein JKF63_04276 [Porcisia hertigi]
MLRPNLSQAFDSRRHFTENSGPDGDLPLASLKNGNAGVSPFPTTAAGANEPAPQVKVSAVTRGGILGCVKQRIFAEMLDPVPGDYNIMVCDNKGAEILSACMRMHDLMDHGVTLIEDLGMPRQSVLSSAAIYFIEPTDESVRQVMNDWRLKNSYREAHVFFTSTAPERLIQLIASEPRLVQAIKTLKDMLLDFAVPESLLFNFCINGDIPRLFPPDAALLGSSENILSQVATQLIAVFFTIGAGVPTVQYQGRSPLAQKVARIFLDRASQASRTNPAMFRMSSAATPAAARGGPDEPPLLILVDRSFDAVEPLLHERTYQCLLYDLMPLENNIYRQTFENRAGGESTRSCPIDEKDPYWCQYRHKFLPLCFKEIPKKLQELMDENPTLAMGMRKLNSGYGTSNKLGAVSNAIRELPEFRERQAKLSLHIDICTKIMNHYKQQKLAEVCELEQDIATGRRPFKEVFDYTYRMTADTSLPLGVRVRLILLLIAGANTRDFPEAKKLMLLQGAGLSNEADRANALALFVSRVGQLPQETAGQGTHKEVSNGHGACGDGKNSPGAPVRRTLRTNRFARQGASDPTSACGQENTTPQDGNSTNSPTPDPYRNQAYLILNAAASNTLNTSDFPVLNTGVEVEHGGSLGELAQQRRALRSDGGDVGMSLRGPGDTDATATLDLGHEGQFALKTRRRVVLFVLGGVTYGEARAAYEISKAAHVEVFVGGTSLLTPDRFLSSLAALR